MITGRLMENGCLIDGHLMQVQLYTEWDDNYVCIINQWKGGEEILHDHEKILCDLKDHVIDDTALLKRDMLWHKFRRD